MLHSHHNILEHEVGLHDQEKQTRTRTWRVSLSLLGTLMGGALLINSLIAEYIFHDSKGQGQLMAMIGAVLLSLPIIWHALVALLKGHSHMDELVALAIIAALAIKDYRVAGAVAFFMLLALCFLPTTYCLLHSQVGCSLKDIDHVFHAYLAVPVHIRGLIHIHTSCAGTAEILQSQNGVRNVRDTVPVHIP